MSKEENSGLAVNCVEGKAGLLPQLSDAIKWTKCFIQRDYFMARLRIKDGIMSILL